MPLKAFHISFYPTTFLLEIRLKYHKGTDTELNIQKPEKSVLKVYTRILLGILWVYREKNKTKPFSSPSDRYLVLCWSSLQGIYTPIWGFGSHLKYLFLLHSFAKAFVFGF